jgi:hypothetical protein
MAQWTPMTRTRLDAVLRLNEVGNYLSLAARQAIDEHWGLRLEWMPQLQAAGLGFDYGRYLRLSMLSDSLRFEDAQVLQLGLSVAVPLGGGSR